ncbi:hypothetical protein CRENPOLYSF1_380003 [Crenothrix polyspora]|uniref:Uncharacterized protein n=1 Tax=Crenothrix polyspora TaxID=360316 RepID=A0A1R4HAJ4_9GAMM|nr:hypothetical protein CRENPOLYSF1_380003 [Crenothrix polyspora]
MILNQKTIKKQTVNLHKNIKPLLHRSKQGTATQWYTAVSARLN